MFKYCNLGYVLYMCISAVSYVGIVSFCKFVFCMIPVDQAGLVTKIKLVSVHMVTFSRLSEMKNLKKL